MLSVVCFIFVLGTTINPGNMNKNGHTHSKNRKKLGLVVDIVFWLLPCLLTCEFNEHSRFKFRCFIVLFKGRLFVSKDGYFVLSKDG